MSSEVFCPRCSSDRIASQKSSFVRFQQLFSSASVLVSPPSLHLHSSTLLEDWNAANRICAKGLMPFLPILIEALERHEHRQISEECRKQLLSMSAATADRLLSFQRKQSQR